jgi:hypothetical protein
MDHRLKYVKRLMENSNTPLSVSSGHDMQRHIASALKQKNLTADINNPKSGEFLPDISAGFGTQIVNIESKARRTGSGGKHFRFNVSTISPIGKSIIQRGSEKGLDPLLKKDLVDHVSQNDIMFHGNPSDGYMVITRRRKEDTDEAKNHNEKIDEFLKHTGFNETHSYHDEDSFFNIFKVINTEARRSRKTNIGGETAPAVRAIVYTRGNKTVKDQMKSNGIIVHGNHNT